MSDIVRFGFVGTGTICLRLLRHLTMADVQDRVKVVALCDPSPGRACAAGEKFGVENTYETFEEMIAADVVDAVSIASPIGLHYEQGMQAIEAGLHVHFNKTIATTVDEADSLIAAAKEKGVKLVASPGEMLNPRLQAVKALIDDGALGTLTWAVTGAAFGNYHQNESDHRHGDDPLTNISPAWYFRKPGGGPLFDMTVYGLHAMTGVLGPARRVTAFSGVRVTEREFRGETLPTDMDDQTLMVLDFGDALFGFVYGVAAQGLPGIGKPTIFGTEGRIINDQLNGQPIDYPGREIVAEHGPTSILPHVVGEHRGLKEAHVYEDIMQLVDLVREDKPTLATPEHARHVVEIFDAAYRSAGTGQAQDLRSTF